MNKLSAQTNLSCDRAFILTDTVRVYNLQIGESSLWYRITFKHKADLALEVIPGKPSTDIDLILYKSEGDSFCKKIRSKTAVAVRSNLSRFNSSIGGKTGLAFDAVKENISSGPGDAFSKFIAVNKGESYYLMINNFSKKNDSFLLRIFLKNEIIEQPELIQGPTVDPPATQPEMPRDPVIRPPVNVKKDTNAVSGPVLMVTVIDDELNTPVDATIDVEGYQNKPLRLVNQNKYLLPIKESRNITLNCNANGFMFYSASVTIQPGQGNAGFEIRLKKFRAGENVILPKLKFKPDHSELLPSSIPSLLNLLKFLQDNPTVVIEIQGHVNAPNMPNSANLKSKSRIRAKAVYDYLVSNGISKERLSYKGLGNEFMIYPNPDKETESEQNRRVEIKIVSFK